MEYTLETNAVHAGHQDFSQKGVHAPPLDLSSTYPLSDLGEATASLDAMAHGCHPEGNPVYARLHNPTVDRFEQALAGLEMAEEAVAFSSGMAAITASLMTARERGGHVVAIRPLYGGTDHLLSSGLLGLEVTWAKPTQVAESIRPDTALVVMETPANPTLELVDIAAVVEQAGTVPVLVDSTFATPVLQRPLELGATFSLHSATKFLGGHGDVVAGVVATNDEWACALRRVRVVTGGLLHPLGAYLLHRGLQTLPLRVKAAQATAQELALRLLDHPSVERVMFPGLPGCDPHQLLGRQMAGPGALLAFEIRGGRQKAAKILQGVRLLTPAVSLGSVDSLIQHPAGLTHHVVAPEARESCGISEGLLRISVGLENVEDLWADLSVALDLARVEPAGRCFRPTFGQRG
ncbi:MAG: PLP-dependent transferase [Nitrospirae bacterium]|nr:PLP-dependent transferase [Nitrospirota bacterium]